MEALLKNLLSSLSKDAFGRFVFELWKLKNIDTDKEYRDIYPLPRLDKNLFESYSVRYSGEPLHCYNLIIPFFCPIELFSRKVDLKPFLQREYQIITKYTKRTKRRWKTWNIHTKGDFVLPDISFVTNYSELKKQQYFDVILPQLETLIESKAFYSQLAIGSCDSFLDLNPKGTLNAFENFLKSHKSEISLCFKGDKLHFFEGFSEKYLTCGVSNNGTLYESAYSFAQPHLPSLINEFQALINSNCREATLEKFISRYYREIFGAKYDKIETQLWLKFPELDLQNKDRRTDIFLRNSIENDWELVELKKPIKLVTNSKDIPVFTHQFYKALEQIRNYKSILMQNNTKENLKRQGIEYCRSELRLVIGKNPDISTNLWRTLKMNNSHDLKIFTYDNLIDEMKSRQNEWEAFLRHSKNH